MMIRPLAREELGRLSELDRTEHVRTGYKCVAGVLVAEAVDWRVGRWSEAEVAKHVAALARVLEQGGTVLGAFDGARLMGVAALGHRLFGAHQDQVQLVGLWVNAPDRRRGVAKALLAEIDPMARALGARFLYISGTPSESAIGFYLSRGARLAPQVDPALFAEEPEDIHLIRDLASSR
jgi:GNAT superfamily N-acetyltransferase